MKKSIILASSSPRRVQMMKEAKIPFEQVIPSEVIERREASETPQEYVKRLALEKSRAGLKKFSNACSLGADTIVLSPEEELFEKPKDRTDALRMLKALQGNTHQVITSYAICWSDQVIQRSILSLVQFRTLSQKAIESYLDDTDEWKDKAGAYAVQGLGAAFILSINGSYHNVVGLPLCHVIADLETVFDNVYPTFCR